MQNQSRMTQPRRATAGSHVRRLQAWLRHVIQSQDPPITAEAWARAAGVAATGITRFLKHGAPVPKLSTVVCLARALNLPAPDDLLSAVPGHLVDIPVISGSIWRIAGRERAEMEATEFTRAPRHYAGCIALRVNTDHGLLMGVVHGDLVLVDAAQVPDPGSLVCHVSDGGDVSVLRFEPPYLRGGDPGRPTLHLAENDVGLVGTVLQLQRDLAPPRPRG